MVFLMEIVIDSRELQLVKEKCGFVDWIFLSSNGLSGRIIGFWWKDLNVRVLLYSAHHLLVEVCNKVDVMFLCGRQLAFMVGRKRLINILLGV